MKIKSITLNNFSKYDTVSVSFDENVTYLIGKNGSGKSTLGISAIWFMFQGIAERASGGNNPLIGERFRFIGPKSASAKGEMILVDEKTGAEISVLRKLTKSGSELSFIGPEGMRLDQTWLNDLFNVFLIAPKKFTELSPKEQANVLGINTDSFDAEIARLKKEYTEINAVYKSFGEIIPVEKVDTVDVSILQSRKNEIRDRLNEQYLLNKKVNEAVRQQWEEKKRVIDQEVDQFNITQKELRDKIDLLEIGRKRVLSVCEEFECLQGLVDISALDAHISELEVPEPLKDAKALYPVEPVDLALHPDYVPAEGELVFIKEIPDDSELKVIDQEIIDAGEINKKVLEYEKYKSNTEKKKAKKDELDANKKAQEDQEAKRLDYVKSFKFPFSNLTVGEDGELLLNGKPIKEPYFSTGELLKVIPILLATTNPELKYVFLQDFNLLDEDKQQEIEQYLTDKGFQLVIEMVGKTAVPEKNCILLKDNVVVESLDEDQKTILI